MKLFSLFFVFIYFAAAYASDDMQNIYERASELVKNDFSGREEEEILFEFYSKKIDELDLEVLKKNPELVFRRALAWFEVLGNVESLKEFKNQLLKLQEDFKFVIDNTAEKNSKLFEAASLRYEFIDFVLKKSFKSFEEIYDICVKFHEKNLKKWGGDPSITGLELREKVFLNVQKDSKIANAFFNYLILFQDDPDLVLGNIKPSEIKIIEVVPDENGDGALLCRIEFCKSCFCVCSIEVEI
jgi:hypothetical protein